MDRGIQKPPVSANSSKSLLERLRVERIVTPPAIREAELLLNSAFPVVTGTSFFDDFPVWNPALSRMIQLVGALDGGVLAGCAGGRVALLKTPVGLAVPTGIIGAVASHPDYRGQGVATAVVSQCVEELTQQGASMILLWGSEHSLYQKLGFDLCGIQKRARLSEVEALDHAPAITIQTGWNLEIARAMAARKTGLKIGAAELPWLSSHKNVAWYWTESKGVVTAYAGVGRGIDLKNIIHEWGGDRDACVSLLAELKRRIPEAEVLGSPEGLESLGFAGVPTADEYLCLAKILDPQAVVEAFVPQWSSAGGKFEKLASGDWKVSTPGSDGSSAETIVIPESALPVLIFGPERFEGPLAKYFPLPLWIWGLDAA